MKLQPVPERAESARPWAKKRVIGPPPGIFREHCGDAEVLIDNSYLEDGMGLTFRAYFKPTDEDIEKLKNDGFVEVYFRGNGLVPFGASIW